MKKSYLLLFFLGIIFFGCNNRKETVATSVFASEDYKARSAKDKISFLDSIQACCLSERNDTLSRNFLFDLSSEYYYLNEQGKSFKINKDLLRQSKEASDTNSLAKVNYYLGDNFEPTRKDSAYHYYAEAEKLFRLVNNTDKTARMMFNKAVILFSEGNYVESEIELAGALQLLKDSPNKKLIFSSYNLMASNFEKLEDYDNAMKYYINAKNVLADLKTENSSFDRQNNYAITSAVNIANIYEKTFMYDRSIAELESIISPSLKANWPSEYAVAVGNLGYSKMKSGKMDGVEKLLLEALQVSQLHDSDSQILYKLNNLGEFYAITGDTAKSVQYLKQSLTISERIKGGEEIKSTLKLLSRVDAENDARYKERYIRHTDSLNKIQRNNRNKYARIEYETSRVEDENKILTMQTVKIGLISMAVIFLLILLLIFRYIKTQKRELRFKKRQQLAEEELFELLKEHQNQINDARHNEQNRISRELHDGIMNRIYGVRLHLGMLNGKDDVPSKNKRLQFVDELQEIEKEIRLISHDLHVDKLYANTDYIDLLINSVEQQNEIGTTKFSFEHDKNIDWEKIDGLVKVTINRVLQEAISNVNKYANASSCVVSLKESGNTLHLVIEDDGQGFDVALPKKGIGLKNMKARVRSVNGKITIESRIGKGTKIDLVIDKQ